MLLLPEPPCYIIAPKARPTLLSPIADGNATLVLSSFCHFGVFSPSPGPHYFAWTLYKPSDESLYLPPVLHAITRGPLPNS
jgi:hypothetical protein